MLEEFLKLPPLEFIREDIRREGMRAFVSHFWKEADPASTFKPNWHIDAITDHLEAVSKRQIKNLVINVPPGTGKSITVSVLWPAYHWACMNAAEKYMFASYGDKIVLGHAERSLAVINSNLYQALFDTRIRYKSGGQSVGSVPKSEFYTTAGGMRFSTTVKGQAVGKHANIQCVDDPVKPSDAESRAETVLQDVIDWWNGTMANRIAEPASAFCRVIIMQRLHDNDLAGYALGQGYEHLCLPMRYDPKKIADFGSSLGDLDPRTQEGELLIPGRFDEKTLATLEKALGTPANVAAQNQQNPTPNTGGYVEKSWFRERWQELPSDPKWMKLRQYWDFAIKARKKDSHSWVSGILVGWYQGKMYLIDERNGSWNYPQSKRAFFSSQSFGLWKRADKIVVEDKANGSPLIQEIASDPTKSSLAMRMVAHQTGSLSKTERFSLQTDKIQAGIVVLPSTEVHLWSEDFLNEIVKFPKGRKNDRADTLEMALADLAEEMMRLEADSYSKMLENA